MLVAYVSHEAAQLERPGVLESAFTGVGSFPPTPRAAP